MARCSYLKRYFADVSWSWIKSLLSTQTFHTRATVRPLGNCLILDDFSRKHGYLIFCIWYYSSTQKYSNLFRFTLRTPLSHNRCYICQCINKHGIDLCLPGYYQSSNGNIFRVTDPLCGKFTGHRCIPLTKASNVELWCFLWSAPEQMIE